jgi:phosphoserine phosphatase RsbU/P
VVSDINMPVMDGLTMLGELKTIDRPIRVVVVSAYGDMDNIRSAMNRGAFDFVTKPINFQDLSVTIDKARDELQRLDEGRRVKQQLNVLQTELSVATRIQQAMLPRVFPAFSSRKDFDIHGEMIAARSVGGDFYDFFFIDDCHLAFVIADVSGKGVPAALFMSSARSLLRATAMQGKSPGQCITDINRILSRESDPAMFLTLFYGVINLETGVVECTSGGHNPPVVYGPQREAEFCAVPASLIVGAMDGITFESHQFRLERGEGLLLYTDGVSEAENIRQEEFSDARLLAAVQASSIETPARLCTSVIEQVRMHAGGAEQSDDMTVVALQFHG